MRDGLSATVGGSLPNDMARYSHLTLSQYCVESYQHSDHSDGNFQYINPKPDLLVFRGTDEIRDVLSDVQLILMTRFDSHVVDLIGELVESGRLQFPITLAGHSMGAAIAQRAGILFRKFGYQVDQIVCFAPPRIGKNKHIKRITTCYRNGNDLVTYVPWFRHQSKPIQLAHFSFRVVSRHRMSEYNHLMRKKYGLES